MGYLDDIPSRPITEERLGRVENNRTPQAKSTSGTVDLAAVLNSIPVEEGR